MKQNVFHFHLLSLFIAINFAGVSHGGISFSAEKNFSELDQDLRNAVKKGDDKQVEHLLKSGANPNIEDYSDMPIIIHIHNKKILELFLKYGANPNATSGSEDTALFQKISTFYAGDTEDDYRDMANLLLAYGANPNHQDRDRKTGLSYAASLGKDKIVKVLLDNKADPNIQDELGMTALLWAIGTERKNNREKIFRLLLNAGANPFIKTNMGTVAFDIEPEVRKIVVEMGMKTMQAARRNRHPLIGQLPPELLRLIEEYVHAPGIPPMNTPKK